MSAKGSASSPSQQLDGLVSSPDSEDKAHTFRKRRLSLTRHHLGPDKQQAQETASTKNHTAATQEESHTEEENDKAHTFRKRRLSLTLSKPSQSDEEDPQRKVKRRRSSVASAGSASTTREHQSLTLHSTELLGGPIPPPSPAVHHGNILYQQQPAPPPPPAWELTTAAWWHDDAQHLTTQQQKRLLNPKWRKRHHPKDESQFPFPREIVGTYSCHGVEPIYDSEYEVEQEEEEDDSDDSDYDQSSHNKHAVDDAAPNDNTHTTNDPTSPTKHAVSAKINQDRGGIAYPYGNSPKTALFAVYDGHGQGGELVSQYALHEVQARLEKHAHFTTNLSQALRETFTAVDAALPHEPLIEPYYAGTTAVVALLRDQQLTLANAGDSRAVLAKREDNGKLTAVDLTVDQNPHLPSERARIERMGGYVTDPPGPGLTSRVWLDPDYTQVGLAMARSIGDHAAAQVGVIADPVVTTHEVQVGDEFLVLASDGVWEFLSSQQAVDIIDEHLASRGATKACQALIEAAAHRWHDEEGAYRDDITAIVVRLPGLWDKLKESSTT